MFQTNPQLNQRVLKKMFFTRLSINMRTGGEKDARCHNLMIHDPIKPASTRACAREGERELGVGVERERDVGGAGVCDDGESREEAKRMTRTYTPSLFLTYGGEEDREEEEKERRRRRRGGERGKRSERETGGEMLAGRMDFISRELHEPL